MEKNGSLKSGNKSTDGHHNDQKKTKHHEVCDVVNTSSLPLSNVVNKNTNGHVLPNVDPNNSNSNSNGISVDHSVGHNSIMTLSESEIRVEGLENYYMYCPPGDVVSKGEGQPITPAVYNYDKKHNANNGTNGLGSFSTPINNMNSVKSGIRIASPPKRSNLTTPLTRLTVADGSLEDPLPVIVTAPPVEVKNGNFSTEDRHYAMFKKQLLLNKECNDGDDDNSIFAPHMRREQYIPLRVAREKLKEVLTDMTLMKHKHIAVVETMEKQHHILKDQLENACADYAKKLACDYNYRVKALDAEYCRRLAKLSKKTVRDEVVEYLNTARLNAKTLEKQTDVRLNEKDNQHEKERNNLINQLELERKSSSALQVKLEMKEDEVSRLNNTVTSLKKELEYYKRVMLSANNVLS